MNCKCGGHQGSKMDKKYLELYGVCWSCDKKRWKKGKLSLHQFEMKEQLVLEHCKGAAQ